MWRFPWCTRFSISSWINTTKITCSTCASLSLLSKKTRFLSILKTTSCTTSSISPSNASTTSRTFRNFSIRVKKFKNPLLKASKFLVKNWVFAIDHVFYSLYSLHIWGLRAHDEAGRDAYRLFDASISRVNRWGPFPFPLYPTFRVGSFKKILICAAEHRLRRGDDPLQR